MHRSAMQKTVALSSCEAELNTAVLCAQGMMYQKNMLESIGLKVELPMILKMEKNIRSSVMSLTTLKLC